MVKEATSEGEFDSPETPEILADDLSANCRITPSEEKDPAAYLRVVRELTNLTTTGKLKSTDAKRRLEILGSTCEMMTGLTLEEIARSEVSPLLRFRGLLETSAEDLEEVRKSIEHVSKLEMDSREKKKVVALLEKAIRVQKQCRKHPIKAWVYVGRDQETGDVFQMDKIHLDYFSVWRDKKFRHSLIMAPPGHSKSTSMMGLIMYEIQEDVRLRWLFLFASNKLASKAVLQAKKIIRSPRYKALFPHVKLLGRKDDAEDSKRSFTVRRPNDQSREATVEAASITSNINGAGFDRILGDDFNNPEVKRYPSMRTKNNDTWEAVIKERLRTPSRARIRVIHTPWHDEDTSGMIQKQVSDGVLKHWRVAVDQFSIKDSPATKKAIPIWTKGGEYNCEYFEEKKLTLADYDRNYRLKARSDRERLITSVAFYPSRGEGAEAFLRQFDLGEKWLSIDPSATNNSQSSKHGTTQWVLSPKKYAFCTEAWFHAMNPTEFLNWCIDEIVSAVPQYKGVQIEAEGAMKGMVHFFVRLLREGLDLKGYKTPLEIRRSGTKMNDTAKGLSKMQRLKEVAPFIGNKLIRFAGEYIHKGIGAPCGMYRAVPGSDMEKLIQHIIDFDGIHNTDGVDSVTQFILLRGNEIQSPLRAEPTGIPTAREVAAIKNPFVRAMQRDIVALERKDSESPYEQEERFFKMKDVA